MPASFVVSFRVQFSEEFFIMLAVLNQIYLTLGPLLITFILGFLVLALLWRRSSKKHQYWKKIGVPYVKPTPFFGSVKENVQKCLHENELERYQKYGRVYGYFEGTKPFISIGEPEHLKNILVKDFHAFTGRRMLPVTDRIASRMIQFLQGEDWKRVRTIVTPTFTTGKIKRMTGIFKECAQTLVQNFREAAKKGEPVNAKINYSAYTMDVIASSAFSTKIDSHNDPNNAFLQRARTAFGGGKVNWQFIIFTLFPSLIEFFRISVFPKDGIEFFSKITLQIIEERRKTGKTRNDFLQLLLDTANELSEDSKMETDVKDDVTENYGKDENDQVFKQTNYRKKTLTQDELIAQCIIFFLAGYETSASTLSFVSYCLALNPNVQEKLIEEIDNVLKENDGDLTYEGVQNMKYLNNVISEAMRLFPPATRLERIADEDYKLSDTGIIIPKGMLVTIPVYAMHRDPKLYPDPEKFDPDRFTPEERAKRDQYAYLPFGHGPRNCIGMRFALVEVKVCLAYVLSNFRIEKCSKTKMTGIFKECAQTLVQNFREAAKKGEPVNAKINYSAYTMDVIASSAFSTKIDSHNDPNNAFLQRARTAFGGGKVNWQFIIFTLFPSLIEFFRISVFPKDGIEFFSKITLQIIEERRKTGKTRNDFLQLLLDTANELSEDSKMETDVKDDVTENYGKDENDQVFKQTNYRKKTLTQDELIAQCIIFFLAGYETSASTLSFVSYCLALNPNVQEKLIEEIDNVLKENDGDLTYEGVQNMKYLNNVISEAMRLFPPATRLERIADEDYKLSDTGIIIPKGMLVTIPVYAMHRDPKLYPDPEKFDPDRFTPEERVKRDQYAYLPFGHGPRNCIGMRFALVEVKVCLAYVLSNFRIKKCSKTKIPLEYHIGHGLLQAKEILLQLEERKDKLC